MLKACSDNGNLKPLVEEGGDYVKVTLYSSQSNTKLSDLGPNYEGLEGYREQQKTLQPKIASELLGVSINTARSRLMDLVKKSVMKKRGAGRAVTYYWVN